MKDYYKKLAEEIKKDIKDESKFKENKEYNENYILKKEDEVNKDNE